MIDASKFQLLVHTREGQMPEHEIIATTRVPGAPTTHEGFAALKDASRPAERRVIAFVAADCGPLRNGRQPVQLHPWRWHIYRDPMLLEWKLDGDRRVPIGRVTKLRWRRPGRVPGTFGWTLIGQAEFNDSALASIVWQGVNRGLVGRVCAVLDLKVDYNLTSARRGRVTSIFVDSTPGACNPRAKILRSWTTPPRTAWWGTWWHWVPVAVTVGVLPWLLR